MGRRELACRGRSIVLHARRCRCRAAALLPAGAVSATVGWPRVARARSWSRSALSAAIAFSASASSTSRPARDSSVRQRLAHRVAAAAAADDRVRASCAAIAAPPVRPVHQLGLLRVEWRRRVEQRARNTRPAPAASAARAASQRRAVHAARAADHGHVAKAALVGCVPAGCRRRRCVQPLRACASSQSHVQRVEPHVAGLVAAAAGEQPRFQRQQRQRVRCLHRRRAQARAGIGVQPGGLVDRQSHPRQAIQPLDGFGESALDRTHAAPKPSSASMARSASAAGHVSSTRTPARACVGQRMCSVGWQARRVGDERDVHVDAGATQPGGAPPGRRHRCCRVRRPPTRGARAVPGPAPGGRRLRRRVASTHVPGARPARWLRCGAWPRCRTAAGDRVRRARGAVEGSLRPSADCASAFQPFRPKPGQVDLRCARAHQVGERARRAA